MDGTAFQAVCRRFKSGPQLPKESARICEWLGRLPGGPAFCHQSTYGSREIGLLHDPGIYPRSRDFGESDERWVPNVEHDRGVGARRAGAD